MRELISRSSFGKMVGTAGILLIGSIGNNVYAADSQMEEVVVTGSYLKSNPADSPSPLSVVTSADIENNHTVDMNELLARIPYQSGGYIQAATFTGGGYQGRLPINLRNLGDAATLPLVNGRRHVPAFSSPLGDATVDINSMIPQMMIDRIEIVKDGSSALYGSDAVAGVVNFITKKDFEGIDIDVRALTDERTGLGDEYSVGLLMGSSSDRGGFVIGMEFLDRNEIPSDHPDVYKIMGGFGVSGTGNPGRFPFADSSPLLWASGNPVPNRSLPRVPEAIADPANPDHWGNADYNCNDAATFDGAGGTLGLLFSNNFCAIDYGNFFSMQEAETLQKAYTTAYFNANDRVEFYFEGGFAEQNWQRPNSLAPQTRAPRIDINHPGLIEDARRRDIQPVPLVMGVRLEGGTRQLTGSTYRPIDSGMRRDGDTIRGVVGVNAELDFGDREWNLNASFTWSEHSMWHHRVEDSRAQETLDAIRGLGGPKCDPTSSASVPGSGNVSYAQTGNFDDGTCYYYNPFGNAHFAADGTYIDGAANPGGLTVQTDIDGDGVADTVALANPPELIHYLRGSQDELDEVEQLVIDIVLAGELFEMDTGAVSMAIGYQQRVDSLWKEYDENTNQNNAAFRFGAADVEGKLTTNAVFLELNAPLHDTVDIQFALRYEDFNELNTSTTDPKISAIWRPNDTWSFRGSWGQSFRVGGLMQLFGTQTIVSNTRDPYFNSEFFLPWISSGNDQLQPEESEAWNLGFSWSGDEGWTEGLSVNFDYWNYDYTNLLSKESAPALLLADGTARLGSDGIQGTADDCFDASCGANPAQVIRNSTLNPVRVLPNFINANSVLVSGADIDIKYEWSNDWGMFKVGLATAWTQKYEADTGGVTTDGVGSRNVNTLLARSLPEIKSNLSVNWAKDRHSIFMLARYIAGVDNDSGPSAFIGATRSLANCYISTGTVCSGLDDSYSSRISSNVYTDLYYNFQLPELGFVPEGSVISIGVRDLFDSDVDHVPNNSGFDGIMQDARGRMWMLRYRASIL